MFFIFPKACPFIVMLNPVRRDPASINKNYRAATDYIDEFIKKVDLIKIAREMLEEIYGIY